MQLEHIWLCFACWLFEFWFLLYTLWYVMCFFWRSFDIKRTKHNLYIPIVTISLIHSLFLCLIADQLSDYPMARGSVSEARTGTLDTAAVENKQYDVPSHSLHCIAWGLSNISNTIIHVIPMQWEHVEMIYGYTFTIQLIGKLRSVGGNFTCCIHRSHRPKPVHFNRTIIRKSRV